MKNILILARKKVAAIRTRLFARYKVVACFADNNAVWSPFRMATHYAADWQDAQEWMACYGPDDNCLVYECFLGKSALKPVAWRF